MRFLSLRKMDRREKAQEWVLAILCWAEMEFGSDRVWKIQRTAALPAMVWGLLHSHLATSFMGLLGAFIHNVYHSPCSASLGSQGLLFSK